MFQHRQCLENVKGLLGKRGSHGVGDETTQKKFLCLREKGVVCVGGKGRYGGYNRDYYGQLFC